MPTPRRRARNRRKHAFLFSEIDVFADIRTSKDGFALISATIILGILLAFSFILLNSSLNTRFVGNVFQQSLSAEQIAEAGLHKAVFCLKAANGTNCGGTYGSSYAGETNVSYGGGRFSTVVTGSGATRTVTSTGASPTGQTKRVKSDITTLPPTIPMTLSAAVQAGSNGIDMSNNVTVIGDGDGDDSVTDSDVTSVGDIECGNNARISGNASVTRTGGKINNCRVSKSAYADILTNDTITLNAYYLTDPSGIAGSTVSGTKYPNSPTPSPVAMPNLDIDHWKSVAEAGGTHVGDYNITGTTGTLGPIKIEGDLTSSNNAILTLTGPVWVTGTVTFANNAVVKLSSTFGSASGVFIADGRITISNNGDFRGSGTAGSVLIVASTNTSTDEDEPAILASNNVTGAVLYAPNGAVRTSNNAGVPAVVGLKVIMDNNTTVNNNGLNIFAAPVNMAESGDTGSWHIRSDSWREFK